MSESNCVFCKIAGKEIPTDPLYEDEAFLAFRDLNPQAPIHVLLIPKAHFPTLMEMEEHALLGRALAAVQQTVRNLGLAEAGFRVVLNTGANGGQTVSHLHFHILGGRAMHWPPG